MKIYLVGGAVRDELLHLPVHENDWVVVGATPEMMLQQGFQQVGKDFPVFLHPVTKDEYALARIERKTSPGYTGFSFNTDTSVTLEEDLLRRDLTINAIAQDDKGKLIDPYHGQKDLADKILRHVSPAFVEDPVRILRIARFLSKFASLGFHIAPETMVLMREMVSAGEVNALVSERVKQELYRTLAEKNPEQFFNALNECGALEIIFPEIFKHFKKVLEHLKRASDLNQEAKLRLIILLQALSLEEIKSFCERLHIPKEDERLAILLKTNDALFCSAKTPEAIINLFEKTDAFRRPERFSLFLSLCTVLHLNPEHTSLIEQCFNMTQPLTVEPFLKQGLTGAALGDALRKARLLVLEKLL
jgi:tRNA nucleotidyltransferase (CCA-adding enzyme)